MTGLVTSLMGLGIRGWIGVSLQHSVRSQALVSCLVLVCVLLLALVVLLIGDRASSNKGAEPCIRSFTSLSASLLAYK